MEPSRFELWVRMKRLFSCLIVATILFPIACSKETNSRSVSVLGEGTFTTGKKSAAAFESLMRSFVMTLTSACGTPEAGACFLAEFCETVSRVPAERMIADPEIQSISSSIESGRSAFNEENGKRYTAAFKSIQEALAAGNFGESPGSATIGIFDLPLLAGARKEGDSCFMADECERGLICNQVSCPGRCQPLPAAGEPCLPENVAKEQESVLPFSTVSPFGTELCRPSAYCDEKTSTCIARKGEGETCVESPECSTGLFCRSLKCIPFRKQGESCIMLVDRCETGLACRDGSCKPPGKDEEPCSESHLACETDLVCRVGVCRPQGNRGEPCARLQGPQGQLDLGQCQTGLYCSTGGKCEAKLTGGAECAEFDACRGYCDGWGRAPKGVCRDTLPAAGEKCGSGSICDACSRCDRGSNMCKAEGFGALCSKDAECGQEGLYCDSSKGRCSIKPVLDEECSASLGCASDFYCGPDGRCRSADRFRFESCASDSQCVSDNCENRTCFQGPCRPPEVPLRAAAKSVGAE